MCLRGVAVLIDLPHRRDPPIAMGGSRGAPAIPVGLPACATVTGVRAGAGSGADVVSAGLDVGSDRDLGCRGARARGRLHTKGTSGFRVGRFAPHACGRRDAEDATERQPRPTTSRLWRTDNRCSTRRANGNDYVKARLARSTPCGPSRMLCTIPSTEEKGDRISNEVDRRVRGVAQIAEVVD